jgi:hypothetical protein
MSLLFLQRVSQQCRRVCGGLGMQRTKLCDGLVGQGAQFQVGHASVVVHNEDGLVARLELDKVPLGVGGITQQF